MADQPTQNSKRRVKNPETFRERAIKAAAETDKPAKRSIFKRFVVRLAQPVGRTARSIFRLKPFQLLRRPLRLIGKVIFPAYFRNSWQELKLVTWPGWRESRRLTGAVLIFAIIFGAAIALVDYGLDKVFKAILLK